jgi:LytS/YehU family sensor histidine kinase
VCKPILIHSPIILELVENAIKYGFETTQGIVVITVTAVVEGSVFKIIVENSGHWVKPSQRIKQSTQLGLTNLTDRLRLAYEDKASLSFEQSSTSVSALVLIHIE